MHNRHDTQTCSNSSQNLSRVHSSNPPSSTSRISHGQDLNGALMNDLMRSELQRSYHPYINYDKVYEVNALLYNPENLGNLLNLMPRRAQVIVKRGFVYSALMMVRPRGGIDAVCVHGCARERQGEVYMYMYMYTYAYMYAYTSASLRPTSVALDST